jgi:A/G-specific adenine glycosylase
LLKWYKQENRDLPWRKTRDPYAVWLSEIMLQQTQGRSAIPYYERFLRALPTIDELARADLAVV